MSSSIPPPLLILGEGLSLNLPLHPSPSLVTGAPPDFGFCTGAGDPSLVLMLIQEALDYRAISPAL